MTEEKKYKLGTEELKDALKVEEGNYFKLELGSTKKIEVIKDQEVEGYTKEFDDKPVERFDLKVKVDNEERIWSCSRKVLETINEYILAMECYKFQVTRKAMAYDIFPIMK